MAKPMGYAERMAWYHQARFGMFIHWGLYSLLARGEWVMYMERIPVEEYARLAGRFAPRRFDADAWAALARDAGMKYGHFTTRHHDGFCLFDSQASDFSSVQTAAKRDFVGAVVTAFRRAGLKVGLYYSLLDWRSPGYWHGPKRRPRDHAEMVAVAHEQVRELMTNYGRIDCLFYDGGWLPGEGDWKGWVREKWGMTLSEFWQSEKLNRMVRKLQPHIIVNDRTGLPADLDTPEQHVTASRPGRGWEAVMTIGDFCGWGYIRNNPNRKSVTQLIQHLVTAASREGNFVLNVGPKADGTIARDDAKRLEGMGEWLAVNGEAVYGSQRCALSGGMIGMWTRKGTTAYLIVFRWPGETACVAGVGNRVKSATVLATGHRARVAQGENGRLFLKGLPKRPPDPHATVIKVELDGEPRTVQGSPLGEFRGRRRP